MRMRSSVFSTASLFALVLIFTAFSALSSDLGYLQVNIANPGISAQVFVNGTAFGAATRAKPINTMEGLPVGSALVRVEAEGFKKLNRTETIRFNQWTQAVYELESARAVPPPPPPPVFGSGRESPADDSLQATSAERPTMQLPDDESAPTEEPSDPVIACRKLLDSGRLAEPPQSNAIACFFRVLEEQPANTEALEALDLIEEQLLARIESAIRAGSREQARTNWEHLVDLSPEHPDIDWLDQRIRDIDEYAAQPSAAEADHYATTEQPEIAQAGPSAAPPLNLSRISGPVSPPVMARIPKGCFNIGSPEWEAGRDEDESQKQICLQAFDMALYEVSIADFHRFTEATGYRTDAVWNRERASGCFSEGKDGGWTYVAGRNWLQPGFNQQPNHPAVCVSWEDAMRYIDWLNTETGHDYRLPTEAEWEYAARAGNPGARYWGDSAQLACQYANIADQSSTKRYKGLEPHECSDGHVQTAPLGSYRPNAYGLYDMLGNVAEWTCSYYGVQFRGSEKRCSRRDSKALRVNRGGSWTSKPAWARSATRVRLWPRGRADSLGFRLARDAPPSE